MKQQRFWILLILSLLAYPNPGWTSDESAWPHAKEWGTYRARLASAQQSLWEASWETTVKKASQSIEVTVYEQGRGKPWGNTESIVWKKEMRLEVSPEIRLKSLEGSRSTPQGGLKSSIQVEVNPQRRKVFCKDTEEKGSKAYAEFSWTPNLIPKEFLFHWIRTLDFEKAPMGECLLLVAPTRRFRMIARFKGVETVITPAGTFSCYRLELSPDLGPLRLLPLKYLIPKITLWCKAQAPHLWVRYAGPIGELGSPSAVIELTSWKTR